MQICHKYKKNINLEAIKYFTLSFFIIQLLEISFFHPLSDELSFKSLSTSIDNCLLKFNFMSFNKTLKTPFDISNQHLLYDIMIIFLICFTTTGVLLWGCISMGFYYIYIYLTFITWGFRLISN